MELSTTTQNHLFPIAVVTDDAGQTHTTPEIFTGLTNVVAIQFRRDHDTMMDTWRAWLTQREIEHPGFHFYELAAMPDAKESPTSPRCYRLHSPVEHLTKALDLVGRESLAILSVSVDGLVHHVERGAFHDNAAARLSDALLAGA